MGKNDYSAFKEAKTKPYRIYDIKHSVALIWDSETKEISEIPFYKMDWKNYNNYKMLKYGGFKATKEGLKDYVVAFHQWVKELQECEILSINWMQYWTNNGAVIFTFKRLCKEKIEEHRPIRKLEASWMKRCYKAGIRMMDESRENKITNCYTYDFTFCHPTVLASKNIDFPCKKGKETTLLEVPKQLEIATGYYHVKITSENMDFRKIFSFSSNNVYTNRSLYHAIKNKEEFGVSIEMIQDGNANAYIYDNKDLRSGLSIFGNWFTTLSSIKRMYPKNGLIKFLGSSLSGELSKYVKKWTGMYEIIKEKMDVGFTEEHDYQILDEKNNEAGETQLLLAPTDSPFWYNFRFKPFMSAFVRNKVARVAHRDIKNVVRVFEDSVTFSKPQDLKDIKDICFEAKSSGLIKYKNVSLRDKEFHSFVAWVKENHTDMYDAMVKHYL